MGTASIVGVPSSADGFLGRYVHYDGYPEHMAATLAAIVARDGIDAAVATIVVRNCGWSKITGAAHIEAHPLGGLVVPGYGVAYTADGAQGDPNELYCGRDGAPSDSNGGATWAYAMTDTAIRVFRRDPLQPVWKRCPDLDVAITTKEKIDVA
jgi:hypothetical protein